MYALECVFAFYLGFWFQHDSESGSPAHSPRRSRYWVLSVFASHSRDLPFLWARAGISPQKHPRICTETRKQATAALIYSRQALNQRILQSISLVQTFLEKVKNKTPGTARKTQASRGSPTNLPAPRSAGWGRFLRTAAGPEPPQPLPQTRNLWKRSSGSHCGSSARGRGAGTRAALRRLWSEKTRAPAPCRPSLRTAWRETAPCPLAVTARPLLAVLGTSWEILSEVVTKLGHCSSQDFPLSGRVLPTGAGKKRNFGVFGVLNETKNLCMYLHNLYCCKHWLHKYRLLLTHAKRQMIVFNHENISVKPNFHILYTSFPFRFHLLHF